MGLTRDDDEERQARLDQIIEEHRRRQAEDPAGAAGSVPEPLDPMQPPADPPQRGGQSEAPNAGPDAGSKKPARHRRKPRVRR